MARRSLIDAPRLVHYAIAVMGKRSNKRSQFVRALLVLGLPAMLGLLAGCPTNNPNPVSSDPPAPTSTPCTGFFGNATPSGTTSSSGNIYFSPYYSTTPTTLQSLSVSMVSGTQYEMGVYADNGNVPTTLLSETGAQTVTGVGWNKSNLPNLSLTSGRFYWYAVFTDGSFGSTADSGSGSHAYQSWSTFGSLPVSFTGTLVPHMTFICITPPCPPGILTPFPMPGLLLSVYGTTCP